MKRIGYSKVHGIPLTARTSITCLLKKMLDSDMELDEDSLPYWRFILEEVFSGDPEEMDSLMELLSMYSDGQIGDRELEEITDIVETGNSLALFLEAHESPDSVSYEEYAELEQRFEVLDSAMAEMMMIIPDLMMSLRR